MVTLRLFAQAREAAGTGAIALDGVTVGEVLGEASQRFGAEFTQILKISTVWLNGAETNAQESVRDADEVAVLPPVSGG